MKLCFSSIFLVLLLLPFTAPAQNKFKKGSIVTATGQKIDGSIKTIFGRGGELVFFSTDNERKSYVPSDLKSFEIDSMRYITFSNEFYEEVFAGEKARLYKKVTDNSNQLVYNGARPVGFVQTTNGDIGDFYILAGNATVMELVTKKNFKSYFLKLLNGNQDLTDKIRNGTIGYPQIKTIVELYND